MDNYTPVPTPLTGDVPLPQDVIDDVVVGTVNPAFQQLADAVVLTQGPYVVRGYFVGGAPVADGSLMPIGFFSQWPSGSYGLAADEITLPFPGVYEISALLRAAVGSVSDPVSTAILIQTSGPSTWGRMTGERFDSDPAIPFTSSGLTVLSVASTVAKVSFRNSSGNTVTPYDGGIEQEINPFVIKYLGPL